MCAVQGYDDMPRSTSINCECCPTAMTASQARHSETMCALKGLRRHAKHNFVRLCVLSKGDNGMLHPTLPDHVSYPRAIMEYHTKQLSFVWQYKRDDDMQSPTLFDPVCCQRAIMACHARRHQTMIAFKRTLLHTTLEIVQPCVLPNGNDGMPRPTTTVCVCNLMARKACQTRRSPTMFLIKVP